VAALISHATQERLKNIVEKLAVIAEHRIDLNKVSSIPIERLNSKIALFVILFYFRFYFYFFKITVGILQAVVKIAENIELLLK
jgi:hypothetical protein